MHAKRMKRKGVAPHVKIMPRDRAVLRALATMKFLRTSQIMRFCFGRSTSTVRLRLRKLLDAGLVRTWVPSLNEENIYSLDRKGLLVLGEEGDTCRVPRRLERHLAHHLCVNDFHINLSLAVPKYGWTVRDWQSDWQLKQPKVYGLVPDALFSIQKGTRQKNFALEVDLGGEPAKTVFAAKLRAYPVFQETNGFRHTSLLVVVPTLRRLSALLEIAARESTGKDVLFTLWEKISQEDLLGRIWASPQLMLSEGSDASFISLADLISREDGEGNA